MSSLLILNASAVVTMNSRNEVLRNVDIYCEDGIIRVIDPKIDSRALSVSDSIINASGMFVYPGLINTHHHLYQTLTRNLPKVQHMELFDWLRHLYQLWRGLDPEAAYLGALVGLGELLKYGCTTCVDHHYVFPAGVPETLIDSEISAASELGIRIVACRGSMSLGESNGGLPPDDLVQTTDAILRDSARLVDTYHDPSATSMCRIALAPCSPFSVSEDLLKETAALARRKGVRLHTHLAETLDEQTYCLERKGMRPLAFMKSVGWTGADVWFAHGVHLDDDEIDELAKAGTGVAHCPSSNMKLASGRARVERMIEAGMPLGLGVDGSASNDCSNMISEIRAGYLLHRFGAGNNAPPPEEFLSMATRGGAAVLGWPELGVIEVGRPADMFIVDASSLDWVGAEAAPEAALATLGLGRPCDFTIVAGEVVVAQGRLLSMDEEMVASRARELSHRLLED